MTYDAVTEIRICNLEEDVKEMKDKFETLRVILNELADEKNDELKDKIKTIGYPFIDAFEEERRKREMATRPLTMEDCERILYLANFTLQKNGFVSVKDLDDIYEFLKIRLNRPKRTNEEYGWSSLKGATIRDVSTCKTRDNCIIMMPASEVRKIF